MKSQRKISPTFLQRLRSTPKRIRHRFKNSKSEDTSDVPDVKSPKITFMKETNNILKKNTEHEQHSFNCKYLGKRAVYTLKPEDCYKFALDLADSLSDSSNKVTLGLQPKYLELTYQPASPSAKQKLKLSQQASLSMFRLNTASRSNSRPTSAYIETPTTVFDTSCRPISTDDSILSSSFGANESNNNCSNYGSSFSPRGNFLEVNGHRERSRTFSGLPDNSQSPLPSLPDPEKILLHEIAYCVTIPERPRIFLLTSKGREGLICRVFMFGNKEKSQAMKLALANQFKNSYLEWQAKINRRNRRLSSIDDKSDRSLMSSTKTSQTPVYSVFGSSDPCRQTQNKNSPSEEAFSKEEDLSSSDDEIFSATEKAAIHREFTRRASCLANPEKLIVSDVISFCLEDDWTDKSSESDST